MDLSNRQSWSTGAVLFLGLLDVMAATIIAFMAFLKSLRLLMVQYLQGATARADVSYS